MYRLKEIFANRRTELLLTSATFLFCILIFHFVSDDYAYFMSSLAAKQFSDFAYFDVHFQGFIGIREVYKLLYFLFPHINWHFAFMVLYEFASLYLLLRVIRTDVLRRVASAGVVIAAQVLAAIYYSDSIISVSHTRVSIVFCGVALLRLILPADLSRGRFWIYGLLFIFGMLLRPESGMGTLAIALPGYIILFGGPVYLATRTWLPVLAMSVFLLIFTLDLHYTDIYSRRVEPEIEYKMMARRVQPAAMMHTAADSARRNAALVGMWFDMRVMTPEYMRSIILPGSDLTPAHRRAVALHLWDMLRFYMLVTYVWMILLLSLAMRPAVRASGILRFCMFSLYCFGVLYALDYNGFLVAHRHFMSLVLIGTLLLTAFVVRTLHVYPAVLPARTWAAIAFLYLAAIPLLSRYRGENQQSYQQVVAMEHAMDRFEQRYTGRIVAITIDGRFLFDRRFSLLNETYRRNRYIMFDWFTFHLTPRYIDYLHRLCGCDSEDPVAFFHWLSDQHALYISDPYRSALTARYMQAVHGTDLRFERPERINVALGIDASATHELMVSTIAVHP